jgi:putative endonuclease
VAAPQGVMVRIHSWAQKLSIKGELFYYLVPGKNKKLMRVFTIKQSGDRLSCFIIGIHMFYVYALSSQTHKYIYVGLTENLERRFGEHDSGKNKTTRPYRPFKILYVESFPTRQEARAREKYLKSGSGKEFLKSLITKTI